MVDGVPGPDGDELRDLRFAGETVSYRLQRGRQWHVVKDGELGPPYASIDELVTSADGAHLAYSARDRGGAVVVWRNPRHIPRVAERPRRRYPRAS